MIKATEFFAGRQMAAAAKQSAVAAIVLCPLFGVFFGIWESLLLGAASFFALLGLSLYYPKMQRKKYGQEVEASMPFLLMNIAIELNLAVPFFDAIGHAGEGESRAAKEFAAVVGEVRQGASMPDALRHMSERVESQIVRRAVVQLVAAFEQASKRKQGEAIKRIAAEILARQRTESKLFAGKLVVLSLLFIAVSAIIPALFQSFSIIGSAVLQWSFSPLQLLLIIAVAFPLLDLAVLVYIREKTPIFMRGR